MKNKNILILLLIFCFFAAFRNNVSAQKNGLLWSEPQNCSELNSDEDDFAPSWNKYESLLYYNSDISGYSCFFTAKFLAPGNFSSVKVLDSDINIKYKNQSYISFISENEAFYSAFRLTDTRSYLNIFRTIKKKQSWTGAFADDSLKHNSYNCMPAVSPDGSVLVFVSDRDAEAGDTDLWMALRQPNGTWGNLVPLNELNSPKNEITPFLASNDTLYFSTNGQDGPGGFDIYMSVFSEGVWQRPVQLRDLNTEYDESDFIMLPGDISIFSSNKPGGKGNLDLYISTKIIK